MSVDVSKFRTVANKLTPLMKAIINNATVFEIEEILMQGGKDTINARSNVGRTAMNYAGRRGNYVVYSLLIEHGGLDLDENSKEDEIPAIGGAASAAHSNPNLSQHPATRPSHNLKMFDQFRSSPIEDPARSVPSLACPCFQDPKLQAYLNSPAHVQSGGNITDDPLLVMMYLSKFCNHVPDKQTQVSSLPTPDTPGFIQEYVLPTQPKRDGTQAEYAIIAQLDK